QTPQAPVYSNVTAAAYPDDLAELQDQLSVHLRSSVRFVEQIESMYAAGVRTFVEVGPGQVLTGLVDRILHDQPHLAVATDSKSRRGLVQLSHALAQLLTAGVSLDLDPLFDRRHLRTFDVAKLERETGEPNYPKNAWVVNGTRNRPLDAPEPRLLGAANRPLSDEERAARNLAPAKPNHARAAASVSAQSATAPVAPSVSTAARASVKATPPEASVASAPTTRGSSPAARSAGARPPVAAPPTTNPPSASSPTGMKKQEAPSASRAASPPDAAQVLLSFQDVMARFLDTQRTVMSAYLNGAPLTSEGPLPALPALPAPTVQSGNGAAERFAAPASGNGHATPGQHTSVPARDNGVAKPAPVASPAAPTQPAAKAEPIASRAVTALATPAVPAAEAPASVPDELAADQTSAGVGGVQKSLDEISDDLLALVSERTGYPEDMLDLDLDLEADLGIDSIKRVEILGGLAESLGEAPSEDGEYEGRLELEKLTTIRTLRGILEYLEDTLFGDEPASASAPTGAASTSSASSFDDGDGRVQRGLVELIEAPTSGGSPMIPRGAVLITDDGAGLSSELTDRMTDFGQRVVLLRDRAGALVSWDGDVCTADLACPDAVAQVIREAREQKSSIAGLIHAAPLASSADAASRLRDVRSTYLLARELGDDLVRASGQGGAFLLVCTGMDGQLGYGEQPLSSMSAACHGGICGLLKCVKAEWPEVLIRAVDFDAASDGTERAERILTELGDREGPMEVGWSGGVRRTWMPVGGELDRDRDSLELPDDAVVLVTGGARGITAAICAELAKRSRVQLVLVGRSPLPEDESGATLGLESPAELKAALMEQLRQAGEAVAPATVEARYQRLLQDREIRGNLADIRAAGAEVEYHSLDVRDTAALQQLVADVVARKGRIDGVIHGAGVIEDKLLKDKTPDSYQRVMDTKVNSALAMAESLDPDSLKFCVFFSSIAGRYGNRGQSDYAAANEVLAKLAIDLNRRWPARVLAVDWGPWGGIGMVADLAKHMAARGVTLITPEIGTEMLLDELWHGAKENSEVIIAGGASNLHAPHPATA
ncbi:MAG: SDR family NAD(P)-dependent oxidoreductase, partial [Planctomycetales bacterium]|nr:SDR family NAD(P)-dependent oxidoreductase [Planctomycetales bacterium]